MCSRLYNPRTARVFSFTRHFLDSSTSGITGTCGAASHAADIHEKQGWFTQPLSAQKTKRGPDLILVVISAQFRPPENRNFNLSFTEIRRLHTKGACALIFPWRTESFIKTNMQDTLHTKEGNHTHTRGDYHNPRIRWPPHTEDIASRRSTNGGSRATPQ